MVSTTMASVMLLLGKLRAPETYKLVEVALTRTVLVAKKLVEVMFNAKILVGLKAPEIERLVKLALTAKISVEVMEVPVAVVNVKRPILPLVEVIDVPLAVVNTKDPSIVVVDNTVLVVIVIAPLTNCISGVPVTVSELE
jgi:hypothetical protein